MSSSLNFVPVRPWYVVPFGLTVAPLLPQQMVRMVAQQVPINAIPQYHHDSPGAQHAAHAAHAHQQPPIAVHPHNPHAHAHQQHQHTAHQHTAHQLQYIAQPHPPHPAAHAHHGPPHTQQQSSGVTAGVQQSGQPQPQSHPPSPAAPPPNAYPPPAHHGHPQHPSHHTIPFMCPVIPGQQMAPQHPHHPQMVPQYLHHQQQHPGV